MCHSPFDYRILWTWDYCTAWDDSYYGRGKGAFGANQRRARFLDDYKRMVDYGAALGFNGIIIWGALRAHNRGEEQLQELAAYGAERGVRILPGCGIFSYGGVYYDPRENYNGIVDSAMTPHRYSLHTWLEQHPQYAAIGPDGQPYRSGPYSDIACPSRPENLAWFKEALAWLLTEFGVGGVQVEVGDYATCYCDLCRQRSAANANPAFRIEDMLRAYRAAIETAQALRPHAWVICESYSSLGVPLHDEPQGFGSAMSPAQKEILGALGDGAIIQWVADKAVGAQPAHRWPADVYLPTSQNIARIHAGSQWAPAGADAWAVEIVYDLALKARASGVNGVSIFGEESPANPPNEANYLALAAMSASGSTEPITDLALFYQQTLDPLYGGDGTAYEWVRIYQTGCALRRADAPVAQEDARERLISLAAQAHLQAKCLSGEPCRRWAWLENWLWRAEWLVKTRPQ